MAAYLMYTSTEYDFRIEFDLAGGLCRVEEVQIGRTQYIRRTNHNIQNLQVTENIMAKRHTD